MMENNNQQRIRNRAMEIAIVTHPDIYRHAQESLIEKYTPAAKLFVDIEAEAFDNGYSCAIMKELGHAGYEKSDCKIRCGLIPPPENSEQGGGGE